MGKRIAQFISFIFHPLLLPTYSFILIICTNPYIFGGFTPKQVLGTIIGVFINTFIFPVITILLMYKLGFIKSLYMQEGMERIIPLFGVIVFYIWTFMSFRKSDFPQILNIPILGACFAVIITFLVTLFKKISLHTVGMGSLVGFILVLSLRSNHDFLPYLSIVIVLAGIVGSARLALNAHDNTEIYAGYVIGFVCQFFALHFF